MKAFLAGALALLVLIAAPSVAEAVTINVNTTQDEYGEGPTTCSLREAITAAQTNASLGGCSAGSGPDTILLPGGTYKITRAGSGEDAGSTGDFDITGPDNLLIRPAGPTDRVIVDGSKLDRVFDKGGMGETTFESIRVMGGKITEIEDGGGIRISSSKLFLDGVTVDKNVSAYQAGGIAVYSELQMVNSTISGNVAEGNGGGLYIPGGGIATVRSSTIVQNFAEGYGGGFAETGSTSVNFTNVLNAGNGGSSPNPAGRATDCYSGPSFYPRFSLQIQALGPLDCLVGFDPGTNVAPTDWAGFIPMLEYNGGQTPTHALIPGSSAIGAGGVNPPDQCPGIDQNGYGRPAGQCDIGAVQFRPVPTLRIVKVAPKKKVIRRKRSKPITVVVTNEGTGAAEGVTVCLRLPKASRKALKIKGKACRTPGNLAVLAKVRPKIKLTAKPGAKKKVYLVKVKVLGKGLPTQSLNIKVRVR